MSSASPLRALRGATTAAANTAEAIEAAVDELLDALAERNQLERRAAAVDHLFGHRRSRRLLPGGHRPAAARLGTVALLDCQQMAVAGDLPRCIRLLAHAWLEPAAPPRLPARGDAAARRTWRSPAPEAQPAPCQLTRRPPPGVAGPSRTRISAGPRPPSHHTDHVSSVRTAAVGTALGAAATCLAGAASLLAPSGLSRTASGPGPGHPEHDGIPLGPRTRTTASSTIFTTSTVRLQRGEYYFVLKPKDRKTAILKLAVSFPKDFESTIDPKNVKLCTMAAGSFTKKTRCETTIPATIELAANGKTIEVFPNTPVPVGKTIGVYMMIFNPRQAGMFQVNAMAQAPGDIPVSGYLGSWPDPGGCQLLLITTH
ncbi:MAG UNVERIFIED_CONTAM: chorismate mutase [Rickettsiaceae bacterium]